MQPKSRRLVTEKNLESYTETQLAPVRATAEDASMDSSEAITTSRQAASKADNAIDRVGQVEAMAGLEPEAVTDAQTANLISQPETSTRAALLDTLAHDIYAAGSPGRQAVEAVSAQVVGHSPVWVQHGDDATFPRPQTLRPVQWHGFVEPENMVDGDMYMHLIRPAQQLYENFEHAPLGQLPDGWVREWDTTGTITVEAHDDALNGKVLQISPEGYGRRAARWAAAEEPEGIGTPHNVEGLIRFIVTPGINTDPIGPGIVLRGSGTEGAETAVVPAVTNHGRVGIQFYVNGSSVRELDVDKPLVEGAAYWMRGRVEDNTAMVKVWEAGSPEPADWDRVADFVYSALQGTGWVGVTAYRFEDTLIDSISFAVDGETAPFGQVM